MNMGEAFPSKYLKASDLNGGQPIVEISKVTLEEVGLERDQKPVVYFRGKSKALVLNKVNTETIATLIGAWESDEWPGHKIKLIVEKVEYKGKRTDGIRVDDKFHEAPAKNGKTRDDEEIPF